MLQRFPSLLKLNRRRIGYVKFSQSSWSVQTSSHELNQHGVRRLSIFSCVYQTWSTQPMNVYRKGFNPLQQCLASTHTGKSSAGDVQEIVNDLTNEITMRNSEMSAHEKESLHVLVERLAEMGVEREIIMQIVCKNPNLVNCQKEILNSSLMFLFNLNFSPNDIYRILTKAPHILSRDVIQLNNRVKQLRKLRIQEGKLQRTIASFPDILLISNKQYKAVIQTFKEMCGFTSEHIRQIVETCPNVLGDDPEKIHTKFHYVYFTKNLTNLDSLVRARLFKHNVYHVRKRILFLERMGLFEVPDKKGNTSILNPSLKAIIDIPDQRFAKGVAKATIEEYQMFGEALRREDEIDDDDDAYSSDEDFDDEMTLFRDKNDV